MGGNHKNNNMLQKNCRLTDSLWITWDSKDIHLQKSSKEIRFELLSEPLGCCGCRKRTNLSSRCEADVSEENLSTQYRVGLWVFHHLTSNVTLHWIYSWIPAISIYCWINVCLLVPVHVSLGFEWTAANIGTNCGQKWTVAGNTVRFPASLAGDESGSPSDASASSAASICSLTLCTFASWYSMHLCCSKTKVLKKNSTTGPNSGTGWHQD